MIAQGIVEYSALTALADAVQHVSLVVQDLLAHVDSRVWMAAGAVLVLWAGRRLLSAR